jgi:hypothetical protein
VNDPPIAHNDTITFNEDRKTVINVLRNDSVIDTGETLTITTWSRPKLGTIARSGNYLVYIPRANISGTETISYTISDGTKYTAKANIVITIRPVNDPVVATADLSYTEFNKSVIINALANDNTGPERNERLSMVSFTQPKNGKVAKVGTQFQYVPETGFRGTDVFHYTVTDGNGSVKRASVTVKVGFVFIGSPNDATFDPNNIPPPRRRRR